jgi:phosphonate transport system substrate-binding protein
MGDSRLTIRFATFLSPVLYNIYEYIARYIGQQLGCSTSLSVGESFEEFAEEQVDAGFICGLPYVWMTNSPSCLIELLAAPVLLGKRYQHRPIYYSDVIVHSESPFRCFDDLQGCTWAYNERTSQSGYNVVCYGLLERGKSPGYFGKMVKSGSHMRSLAMVLEREVDATAIDSHLLDILRTRDETLTARLRVIDVVGPSSIQPVVVSKRVEQEIKRRMQKALISMHHDSRAASKLNEGMIERFAAVTDEDYGDIRRMLAQVEEAGFPFE